MSGGGGGYYPTRRTINSRGGGPSGSSAASLSAEQAVFDAEINELLQDYLKVFNDRDTEKVRDHLETLKRAIEKDIDGTVSTLFGGSVTKHTYVDGLSDVDVLCIVNDSSLENATPQEALEYIEQRLQERLPNTHVKAGLLAVTVIYADNTEIQILPALKTATGVRIADPENADWSCVVRPQSFANKLTEVNQSCSGKVVRVIKLFKSLQTSLPKDNQLKGYHIESLAIEAFENYEGRRSYKDMLLHFIRNSSSRVLSPLQETTGQSLHVDDYLGDSQSTERVRRSRSLQRLAARLESAADNGALETWDDYFSDDE